MNHDLTFTVIICAYTETRWAELITAVDSIKNQQRLANQLIIVIDHNEALFQRAQQAFSDAIILKNRFQRGLSGARNSGIHYATGDIIAFMDEDAVALPSWLETLAAAYQTKDILGVGGQIKPNWINGRPKWFPREFDWVVGCTYLGMPENPAPVRNLIGCNMSFRKDVFLELGGFQEGIGRVGTNPVGCEETEFCIRIHQKYANAILLFQPKAVVQHWVPTARGQWNYFKSRCYSEGISKAQVAVQRGQKDTLSNEKKYTLYTLPMGAIQGVLDFFKTRKFEGLLKAGAINLGLIYTIMGYAAGRLSLVQIKGHH
jgi:glycosyltransferase involved in cell wall biosynthesis